MSDPMPMTLLLLFQTLLCLALAATHVLNRRLVIARSARRARVRIAPAERPFVSVCVPARNEQANIRRSVESLAAMQYADDQGRAMFEVLVLDDCSDDATAQIVEEIAARSEHVRLIRGADLPPGWIGKSHACDQMQREARGEFLLFTDADSKFEPDALSYAIEVARTGDADLLTGVPRLLGEGFWAQLIVPIYVMFTYALTPLSLLENPKLPRAAAGSGAFLLFKREAYDAIGGHQCVKGEIVEDITLTRRVKEAGRKLGFCHIADHVSVTMYRTGGEVWEGLTKNIFSGLEFSWLILLSVCAWSALVFVLPAVWFVFGESFGWDGWRSTVLPLLQITAVVFARVGSDSLGGRPGTLYVLLMPVMGGAIIVLGLASALRSLTRQPTQWRGREYGIFKDKSGEFGGGERG